MTETGERTFKSALIVDDHPLFCDALSMTLRAIADISDINTAASLAEGLNVLEAKGRPDLVVLDLNLPDVDGLDGLIRLRNAAGCLLLLCPPWQITASSRQR